MKTNQAGLELIKSYEGLRTFAYDDSTGKRVTLANPECHGVLTIGYGHTGKDVYPNLVISATEAERLLQQDLTSIEMAVEGVLRGVSTSQNEFSAMVCLAFNIGPHAFKESSVRQYHIAGDKRKAAASFSLWNKVTIGGKKVVSEGLTKRRKAESALYLTAE